MALPAPSRKQRIDLASWERRDLFTFFRTFSEPFHGVCLRVDCTETYQFAKQYGFSIFLSQVHRCLVAAQSGDNCRLRLAAGEVWRYDEVYGGSAVGRPNGTIGFAHYAYRPDLRRFVAEATEQYEHARHSEILERPAEPNLLRFSTLPWFDFTSISHARNLGTEDSAPLITFGKMTESSGRRTMPVSIHVHHGLVDGLHVAQFVERFQHLLHSPEETPATST